MLRPTVIKPIWLMEEQASVRLRSTDSSASSAPRNMVIAESTSRPLPKASFPAMRREQITIMPNTPDLVRMPDKSAEAGAGATGCALGSQMCTGNRPALPAKPTSVSQVAAVTSGAPSAARAAFMPSKDSVPRLDQSINRPISVVRPPMTATAR